MAIPEPEGLASSRRLWYGNPMKNFTHNMKRTLSLVAIGAFLGVVLCSIFAPGLLRWYAAPVVSGKPFTCEMEVQWAAKTYAMIQWVVAGLMGALVALIGGFVSAASRRRDLESAQPPAEGQGTPGDPGAK